MLRTVAAARRLGTQPSRGMASIRSITGGEKSHYMLTRYGLRDLRPWGAQELIGDDTRYVGQSRRAG